MPYIVLVKKQNGEELMYPLKRTVTKEKAIAHLQSVKPSVTREPTVFVDRGRVLIDVGLPNVYLLKGG